MPEPAIIELLRARLGLDAGSIGMDSILRIVERRKELTRQNDSDAYAALAAASPQEFEALVNELVVPETWFFRDREPFCLLAKIAAEKWRTAPRIRVLSAPCSTGEEAYSIAITLLEAGFAADRIRVDAVDISERALDIARSAVYGPTSFRGQTPEQHAEWFEAEAKGRRVRSEAAACVRFFYANLTEPTFGADEAPYHVVFCRNLLIYLTTDARARVLANLDRLLMPGGLLFCGHAELGIVRALGHQFAPHPGSFACVKPEPGQNRPKPAQGMSAPASKTPAARTMNAHEQAPKAQEKPKAPGTAPKKTSPEPAAPRLTLDRIRKHADQGHFDEAQKMCLAFIAANPPDPEAFFLLGLIHEASGHQAEADESYRKALYLAPTHVETLVNLSLLCEQRGDPAQARILRERLKRQME